jgi:hypothetical protein
VVVLSGLLFILGLICFKLKFWILDLDIWVHIRVGGWIIQNHAFPHVGVFSRTAAERPWIAYSWGYEILCARAYAWFGIMGIAAFEVLMVLAVAYTTYWMTYRLRGSFWLSCLLATAACAGFLIPAFALRCFTMLLFAITATLILEANRSGRVRLLYWLPLIFLVWANLHIQFIYGIFVVGLFVTVNLLLQLANSLGFSPAFVQPPKLPVLPLIAILAACLLATCIGPYTFHVYKVVYGYSQGKEVYSLISELRPPDFDHFSHYVELILAAAAFIALGWRKQIDLFKLALLVVASVFAFRAVRDAWFVCITSVACIADLPEREALNDRGETLGERLVMAAIVVMALWLVAPHMKFTPSALERAMGTLLPVDAVNFLHRNPQPGPLYNTLDWGDYLILFLPDYPVAVDGRTDLYGDEMMEQFALTARGVSYKDDRSLNESRLIILPRQKILTRFLTADPRYTLLYQDDVAMVFIRP